MVLICAIPSKDNVQDLEATKQAYTNLMGQTKGAPLKYYMMSKTGEKHILSILVSSIKVEWKRMWRADLHHVVQNERYFAQNLVPFDQTLFQMA